MPEPRTESEVAKYIEAFPSVSELKRQLAANKMDRQVLNQMLKIAEQRERDEGEGAQDPIPATLVDD